MASTEWRMQGFEFANCNCHLARIHWSTHGVVR